ncbi:immunoglobulin-like domain-containing protein [Lactobacillus equicursoris]|uniref:immunoglobulin-like domain-containing protein n=1 Tax=Lactobacillus equicursoris TaxID=420645 RepID=UPI002431280B|nr:immunoglobulin-like domain-containing protein [Lactobacillus equicursoris]MDD6387387.1 DUF5011 domain-containing protein [Lactobacillus equicursoris]
MKRKNKRVIRLASIALMSAGLFGVSVNKVQATDDHEGPKVESITTDKKEAKPGDTVHFVAKVSDQTGTKELTLQLLNGSNFKYIHMTKKDANTFEGDLKVDDSFANGKYNISVSDVTDDLGNIGFGVGDFGNLNITGGTDDHEGPKVESITINKKEAKPGDTVHFAAKVSDQTGTKELTLQLLNGSNFKYVHMTKKDANTFEGDLKVDDSFANGKYSISVSDIIDDLGNIGFGEIPNDCSLFVYSDPSYDNIPDLKGVTIYTKNETVSNTSIDGDVYIAPNAIVHFNNVKVSGKIYVLGGLYANSVSADSLYFLNMTIGGYWFSNLSNGQVILSGNTSISNFIAQTYPVENIPYQITDGTPVKIIDGKLNLKGVYANIADAYLNDHKITPLENGKFVIKDLDVGDADKLTLKFVTVFGNTIEYNIPSEQYVTGKDGKTDAKPVIKSSDIKVHVGDKINFKDYASATDKEDGDLTSKIKIDSSDVNTEKPGNYSVVFSVTDKDGATTTKKVSVVVEKSTPNYKTPSGLKSTYGSKLSSISLPSGFKWDNPNATLDKVGQATYIATYDPDSSKYNAVKGIKITVDVAKANTSYTTPTGLKGTYGTRLSSVSLPSGFKWDNPNATLDKVGQATYIATYDPDSSKYNAVKNIKITVTVAKAKPVPPTVKTLNAKSGAKLSSLKLPAGYKWVNGNTVLKTIGTQAYKAIYNPDSSKYESITINLAVKVTKASSKSTKPGKKPKATKPKSKKVKTKKSKKISVAPTFILKLKSGKKSFVVTWKKAKGASGYQVRYTYKKNLNTAKAHNVKSLKYSAKKLKSKKKYYVQVRTFKKVSNKTYYAAWSKIKSVKVK